MAWMLDQLAPQAALIEAARDFHGRGWMAGTAGNLSARTDAGLATPTRSGESFWITASGLPKGALGAGDFIRVDLASGDIVERLRADAKPSAEITIHQTIYQLFPDARACMHVHSVDSCLATEPLPPDSTGLSLPPLEMLKGLGIWEEIPRVTLPLFTNYLDVPRIAREIRESFDRAPPQVPGLLIKGHGVTTWGRNLQETYNRVEILEFLFSYLARAPRQQAPVASC